MTPPEPGVSRARWVLVGGVGASALLYAALTTLAGVAALDAFYLGALLVLLPALAVALTERGYDASAIAKILGENWLRVAGKVWK